MFNQLSIEENKNTGLQLSVGCRSTLWKRWRGVLSIWATHTPHQIVQVSTNHCLAACKQYNLSCPDVKIMLIGVGNEAVGWLRYKGSCFIPSKIMVYQVPYCLQILHCISKIFLPLNRSILKKSKVRQILCSCGLSIDWVICTLLQLITRKSL